MASTNDIPPGGVQLFMHDNLHFDRISSTRERKYKPTFKPNVAFNSLHIFVEATITNILRKVLPLRKVNHAMRKILSDDENRFGELHGFDILI